MPVIEQVLSVEVKTKFCISGIISNFATTFLSILNVYSRSVDNNSSPEYHPKNSYPNLGTLATVLNDSPEPYT